MSAKLLSVSGDPALDCARNAVARAMTGMLAGSGAGEARQHGGIGALYDPEQGIIGIDGAKPKVRCCVSPLRSIVALLLHVVCCV